MIKKLLIFFAFLVLLAGCNKPNNTQDSTNRIESTTPYSNEILAGSPVNIVINTNSDLTEKSELSIKKDGQEYSDGKIKLDQNKLAMRTSMQKETPSGKYQVSYNACFTDNVCQKGEFEFTVDLLASKDYSDQTNKETITIDMKNIMFLPEKVKISKGTTITWTNSDQVSHYVNTDSHPAHTYEPGQNSNEVKPGESFSYTFSSSGIYPYHCSAHAQNMKGSILVQ